MDWLYKRLLRAYLSARYCKSIFPRIQLCFQQKKTSIVGLYRRFRGPTVENLLKYINNSTFSTALSTIFHVEKVENFLHENAKKLALCRRSNAVLWLCSFVKMQQTKSTNTSILTASLPVLRCDQLFRHILCRIGMIYEKPPERMSRSGGFSVFLMSCVVCCSFHDICYLLHPGHGKSFAALVFFKEIHQLCIA